MRRFRQITDEAAKDRIEADLELWSYYREIEDWEWDCSSWFRWGEDVILWYNLATEPPDPRWLAFHICVEPSSRSTIGSARRLFTGVEVIAELLDAEAICAILTPRETILHDYLERLGWYLDEGGRRVRDLKEA